MIKKNLKALIITSVIILLPIAAGIILWNKLPEQLPVHWNVSGEVDGWAGKSFAVFGLPIFLLAIQWICVLATTADPKSKNHTNKMLLIVFWIIPAISVIVSAITYAVALGKELPVDTILCVFMGLMFVIIGNYLPKCKQNYTMGIKIPWTLNSEENWNRTHRFAGWLWVVCGALMMLLSLFVHIVFILPITFIMVLLPLAYSYVLHRKGVGIDKEDENDG